MILIDFAIVILFFVAVIVFGVVLNIYLYSRGALDDDYYIDNSRYESCVATFPEFEQPVVKAKNSDSVMGDYVRRVVLLTFAFVGLLIVLCIVLITGFR